MEIRAGHFSSSKNVFWQFLTMTNRTHIRTLTVSKQSVHMIHLPPFSKGGMLKKKVQDYLMCTFRYENSSPSRRDAAANQEAMRVLNRKPDLREVQWLSVEGRRFCSWCRWPVWRSLALRQRCLLSIADGNRRLIRKAFSIHETACRDRRFPKHVGKFLIGDGDGQRDGPSKNIFNGHQMDRQEEGFPFCWPALAVRPWA